MNNGVTLFIVSLFIPKGMTMSPDKILVIFGGLAAIAFIVWFFWRTESASCSEMVLIPDFKKSAKLPEGETVSVEFIPDKAGEFEFQCQMGMLRGKVIVE